MLRGRLLEFPICSRFNIRNQRSSGKINLICIFIISRSTSNMAEGNSYGCKTYFLISFEGILYLLQLVRELC